ncbi:hypothetical protein LEQ06_08135 [Paraclostridium sp. AKS46]|nr:hypothetical protein [Paraclostridium sp. AKS46]
MKEFYGNASVVINFNFNGVKAKSLEEAKDIVLGSEEMCFGIVNKKTDEEIDIDVQEWNIPEEVGRGNITESGLSNFWIEEEK